MISFTIFNYFISHCPTPSGIQTLGDLNASVGWLVRGEFGGDFSMETVQYRHDNLQQRVNTKTIKMGNEWKEVVMEWRVLALFLSLSHFSSLKHSHLFTFLLSPSRSLSAPSFFLSPPLSPSLSHLPSLSVLALTCSSDIALTLSRFM